MNYKYSLINLNYIIIIIINQYLETVRILTFCNKNHEYYVECFSFDEKHRITRRSSSETDFGCENHTTGLAAAALALFVRENIENAFRQFEIV